MFFSAHFGILIASSIFVELNIAELVQSCRQSTFALLECILTSSTHGGSFHGLDAGRDFGYKFSLALEGEKVYYYFILVGDPPQLV